MIAIPAIDLRDGACVQLIGGAYDRERIRLDNPVAVARQWATCGFRHLHVVDLDAATGVGSNHHVIANLLDDTEVDVRVGGGVRTGERVDDLIASGASFVIVGTRAIESPDWLEEMAAGHPGRIIVAADVNGRAVLTHGWTQSASIDIHEFVAEIEQMPIAALLATAIHQEGRMAGPDLALMQELTDASDVPIIASGGIASRADLCALQYRGVSAAVIGMALYTGALDPFAIAEEFSE